MAFEGVAKAMSQSSKGEERSTKSEDLDPIKLVKIAQRDFEAAKALFERKLNANAVCMLQQSIEKAAKAILIKLGLIRTEEELRKRIGHEVSRNVLKLLEGAATSLILEMLDLFLQLSKDEAKSKCSSLILDSLHLMHSLYKEYMSKREQISDAIEGFSKIVFMDVSKDVEEKAKEYIDKHFSYTYMLLGLIPDEILTAIASVTKCLGIDIEVLKKYLIKKSMELYLWETLGFIMLFHVPFESAVNKLRYSIESIDENKFIVWWSKEVMNQIENAKMLECIEEYIEEKIIEPKCKEILDATLNVFILKLKRS
jgi:HEPN domain-containing protein